MFEIDVCSIALEPLEYPHSLLQVHMVEEVYTRTKAIMQRPFLLDVCKIYLVETGYEQSVYTDFKVELIIGNVPLKGICYYSSFV